MTNRVKIVNICKISAMLVSAFFMPGCASMKNIVRDTSGTLLTITTMTELEEVEGAEQLYDVQERILESCKPMLESARIKFEGDDITLSTMLDFLLSYDGCRKTLDAADKGLAQLASTRKTRLISQYQE